MESLHRGSERGAGSSVTIPAEARVRRGAAEPPQRRLVVADGVGVGYRSSEHTRGCAEPREYPGKNGKNMEAGHSTTFWWILARCVFTFQGLCYFPVFFSPVYSYVRVHKEESVVGHLPEKTAQTWFQANRKSLLTGQQPLWVF